MCAHIIVIYCSKFYPGKPEDRTAICTGDYDTAVYICSRDSGGDTGLLYKVSVLGHGASYDQWFFDGCDRVCTGRYPESEQADFVSAVTGVSCNCCLLFFYDDRCSLDWICRRIRS